MLARSRGGLGAIAEKAQLLRCQGGDHHARVIGSDHTVYLHAITQCDDRLGCPVRVGTVDLKISVSHVDRRRVLGRDDEIDAKTLGGLEEVGGPIGRAGEDMKSTSVEDRVRCTENQ